MSGPLDDSEPDNALFLLLEFSLREEFETLEVCQMYEYGLVELVETTTGLKAMWMGGMRREQGLLAAQGLKRILSESPARR